MRACSAAGIISRKATPTQTPSSTSAISARYRHQVRAHGRLVCRSTRWLTKACAGRSTGKRRSLTVWDAVSPWQPDGTWRRAAVCIQSETIAYLDRRHSAPDTFEPPVLTARFAMRGCRMR